MQQRKIFKIVTNTYFRCLNYGFGLYAYSASCTACGSHKASSTGATCDKCEDYYYLVGTNCIIIFIG